MSLKTITAFLIFGLVFSSLTFAEPVNNNPINNDPVNDQTVVDPENPASNQVVVDPQQRLAEKEKKAAELKARRKRLIKKLERITAEYQRTDDRLDVIKEQLRETEKTLDQANTKLTVQQDVLNNRASQIYKNPQDIFLLNLMLNVQSLEDVLSNIKYLRLVGEKDANLVKEAKDLRDNINLQFQKIDLIKQQEEIVLKELIQKKEDIERHLEAQSNVEKLLQSDIYNSKSVIYKVGTLQISIVFPVAGPHSYTNDWGAPRSGGRRHKGNDIFAKIGTPVVATTDGYIGKFSPVEKGLGGITAWVYGDDSNRYYYAHLSKLADGLDLGVRVKAGQVIGYVGKTGNARTTPPHLHFQIHPGGGRPTNPYPFLRASDPNLW